MSKTITVACVFLFALGVSLVTTRHISGTTQSTSYLTANILGTTADYYVAPFSDSVSNKPRQLPTQNQDTPSESIAPAATADAAITFDLSQSRDATEHTSNHRHEIDPEDDIEHVDSSPITRTNSNPCPSGQQTITTASDYHLLPMGPDYSIGDYIPDNLSVIPADIDTWGRTLCLVPEAVEALHAMNTAARNDGIRIAVISAFRTQETQARLKRREADKNYAYPYIANPGHSEHQLGTTIDLAAQSSKLSATSPEYQWLARNAAQFGFVQSYKAGTEEVTGYHAEPWHWRYVGTDIAQTLASNSQLTLYEYLQTIQVGG